MVSRLDITKTLLICTYPKRIILLPTYKMGKKKLADTRIVLWDVFVALVDTISDWIYLSFLYHIRDDAGVRNHQMFGMMIYAIFFISIIGTILSTWLIGASLERKCRSKMSLCGSTVPRLSMTLILVHHVPIFVLVTYTDVPCMGGYTRWGIVNICTSMIALINALRSTRCGEGYCGEAFCDKLSCIKGADEDECELTTIASDSDEEEEEDTIQAEYVKMDVPAENLSHVTGCGRTLWV